ncbi:MAG: hypothetical protein AVO38_01955 [delta proteobacterium ML8_D]|nr:MAG: hypothetical protein AVO38_01955 [delta proteobacterium ML8_D]
MGSPGHLDPLSEHISQVRIFLKVYITFCLQTALTGYRPLLIFQYKKKADVFKYALSDLMEWRYCAK